MTKTTKEPKTTTKGFRLKMTNRDLKKFQEIEDRYGFLTDAEAIRFIINHYYELQIVPLIAKQEGNNNTHEV